MSDSAKLKEIRERREYSANQWQESRDEQEVDLRNVAGNPWDEIDLKARKNRPIIAPDEMSQYRNQVINAARANPTGMKFSPIGNGATDRGAEFYQNKAREIEYRSHAQIAYITALDNALKGSYGFIRVETRFESPRSANQEIWIEGFPDPNLVMPDPDAKRPDSSDMQYCFVDRWTDITEHQRRGGKLKPSHLRELGRNHSGWVQGDNILEAEYWEIATKERALWLVQPMGQRGAPPVPPVQMFEDEIAAANEKLRGALKPIRKLRDVDYPAVKQYFTNGLEIIGDVTDWPGKYIPIVSCYGEILYVPDGGITKRQIRSMTRSMRAPWKAFCYTCCQELEVLAMTPKAPLLAMRGQFTAKQKKELKESIQGVPKAVLEYEGVTEKTGQQVLPPPGRVEYTASQHLQALEVVKEGWRRAIQAAAGSNFLPTNAQRHNEKSGVALDKIDQSAAQGTFHFLYSRNGMIRQTALIIEDLIPFVHSQQGETGVMVNDTLSKNVPINNPTNPDAYDTKGDYLPTVSTGPSSESERGAVSEFTDTLVGNIGTIAEVSGKHAAAQVMAQAIRNKNLGTGGDQLADIIEPPAPNGPNGKPLPPEAQALMGTVKDLQGKLKQAAMEKQTDQVKYDSQFKIESMKADKEAALKLELQRRELAAKIEVARISASKQSADPAAEAMEERLALAVDSANQEADRQHERDMLDAQHASESALSAQDHGQNIIAAQHAADIAPPPVQPTA